MTLVEVTLPFLGKNLTDATVTNWHKKIGDVVKEDDKLVEIKFDGKVSDVLSPFNGVLKSVVIPIYENVEVGNAIAIINTTEQNSENQSPRNENAISSLIDRADSRSFYSSNPYQPNLIKEKSKTQISYSDKEVVDGSIFNLVDRTSRKSVNTNEINSKLVENKQNVNPKLDLVVNKKSETVIQKPIINNSNKTIADILKKKPVNAKKNIIADIPLESSIEGYIGYDVGNEAVSKIDKKEEKIDLRSDEDFLKKSVANLVDRIKTKKNANGSSIAKNDFTKTEIVKSNALIVEQKVFENAKKSNKISSFEPKVNEPKIFIDKIFKNQNENKALENVAFDADAIIEKVNEAKKAISDKVEEPVKTDAIKPANVTALVDRNMSKGITVKEEDNLTKKEEKISEKKETILKEEVQEKKELILEKKENEILDKAEKKALLIEREELLRSKIISERNLACNKSDESTDEKAGVKTVLNNAFSQKQNKVSSKSEANEIVINVEADVTNLYNWQKKVKSIFYNRYNEELTFTPLILELIIKSISDFPLVNSTLKNNKIVHNKCVNMALAFANENKRIAYPVIKNAESNSLIGLVKTLKFIENEKADKPTFTFANLGIFDIDNLSSASLSNQTSMICIGAVRKKASVLETASEDVIAIRNKIMISGIFNLDIMDAFTANVFVRRIVDYIENFEMTQKI